MSTASDFRLRAERALQTSVAGPTSSRDHDIARAHVYALLAIGAVIEGHEFLVPAIPTSHPGLATGAVASPCGGGSPG